MSATETIISFAAKQVVDRIFSGPAKIVTTYHNRARQTDIELLQIDNIPDLNSR